MGKPVHIVSGRNYLPSLSQWLSIDPMARERYWLSPYYYVQNSPFMRVDPSGRLDIENLDGGVNGCCPDIGMTKLQSEINNVKVAAMNLWTSANNTLKDGKEYLSKGIDYSFNVYNSRSFQGGLNVIGGGINVTVGTLSLVTPEPTTVTKVAGTYMIVQGYASLALGISQIIDAQDPKSNREIGGGLITQTVIAADPNNLYDLRTGAEVMEFSLGLAAGKFKGPVRLPMAVNTADLVVNANSGAQIASKVYHQKKSK